MPIPWRIPIPVSVFEPLGADVFDTTPSSKLRPRDDNGGNKGPNHASIIVAGLVVGIMAAIAFVITIRTLRHRHPNPKYIPTPFLKRLWTSWKVPNYRSQHSYEQAGHDEESSRPSNRTQHDEVSQTLAVNRDAQTDENGVNRNISVRSVMTLPVYRPKPGENEQVLGVEGERDGIDVVVEMPTAENEEELREEEMEALYQIRAARRRQIAEREERRRLRREARDAGNLVALEELREQARGLAGRNTQEIDELRQEHERIRDTRTRAVSSVSYADLGVARADGTRIRANSTESERIGLLSDAASIAQSAHSGADSLFHRRDGSASALSIDTARSNEPPLESPAITMVTSNFSLASAPRGRSRTNSGVNTPRISNVSTRAGSSPEIIDAEDGDLGDSLMPPPGYDEVSLDEITPANSGRNSIVSGRTSPYNEPPPDYPGPAQARNNRLSAHVEDLAQRASGEAGQNPPTSPSQTTLPRLPSLRLPQIIIDPSGTRS